MMELLTSLWNVLISLTIWTFVFSIYVFIGALFGAWFARRKGHDSDNLGWIILGVALFAGVLFPFTYYVVYTG